MTDLDNIIRTYLEESIQAKRSFLTEDCGVESVRKAALAMTECYRRGGKVLVFGNGGSAADSQHLAAELIVRFEKERRALPAIALTTDTSVITAAGNDYDFTKVFSRQVEALAVPGDIVFAISTSGNSANVIEAVRAAKKKGVEVIALTGKDGGWLAEEADMSIVVKQDNTARVQEIHVTLIHVLCRIVEDSL
ncbi:MAG: D-sedoheptulose 7-phosphate isomerase [Candidatus Omnitrophota bacterium]